MRTYQEIKDGIEADQRELLTEQARQEAVAWLKEHMRDEVLHELRKDLGDVVRGEIRAQIIDEVKAELRNEGRGAAVNQLAADVRPFLEQSLKEQPQADRNDHGNGVSHVQDELHREPKTETPTIQPISPSGKRKRSEDISEEEQLRNKRQRSEEIVNDQDLGALAKEEDDGEAEDEDAEGEEDLILQDDIAELDEEMEDESIGEEDEISYDEEEDEEEEEEEEEEKQEQKEDEEQTGPPANAADVIDLCDSDEEEDQDQEMGEEGATSEASEPPLDPDMESESDYEDAAGDEEEATSGAHKTIAIKQPRHIPLISSDGQNDTAPEEGPNDEEGALEEGNGESFVYAENGEVTAEQEVDNKANDFEAEDHQSIPEDENLEDAEAALLALRHNSLEDEGEESFTLRNTDPAEDGVLLPSQMSFLESAQEYLTGAEGQDGDESSVVGNDPAAQLLHEAGTERGGGVIIQDAEESLEIEVEGEDVEGAEEEEDDDVDDDVDDVDDDDDDEGVSINGVEDDEQVHELFEHGQPRATDEAEFSVEEGEEEEEEEGDEVEDAEEAQTNDIKEDDEPDQDDAQEDLPPNQESSSSDLDQDLSQSTSTSTSLPATNIPTPQLPSSTAYEKPTTRQDTAGSSPFAKPRTGGLSNEEISRRLREGKGRGLVLE